MNSFRGFIQEHGREEDARAGAGTEGTSSVTGHRVVNGGSSSQMPKRWNYSTCEPNLLLCHVVKCSQTALIADERKNVLL